VLVGFPGDNSAASRTDGAGASVGRRPELFAMDGAAGHHWPGGQVPLCARTNGLRTEERRLQHRRCPASWLGPTPGAAHLSGVAA
jgi:hypothetical protein